MSRARTEQEIDQVINASLAQSIKDATEAVAVGRDTMVKLGQQHEQLQHNINTMDQIDASLTRSSRLIRGMRSYAGTVTNWFTKSPDGPRSSSSTIVSSVRPAPIVSRRPAPVASTSATVTDQQLDTLGAALDELNGLSKDLHRELTTQNAMIDVLDDQVSTARPRLQELTHSMRRIK